MIMLGRIALLLLVSSTGTGASSSSLSSPLLLSVARGETVDRVPVWMMRQAGRHMHAYRELVKKYPTFRQRSETPDVSRTISLQPLDRYGVDGVILFSDILTPLPAMGIDFDISEGGKIKIVPIQTREELEKRLRRVSKIDFRRECNFVGAVLEELSRGLVQSSPETTLIGFVGLPFTLASYLVEGKTGVGVNFPNIRKLMEDNPDILHAMLSLLADNIINYACYQIESGAQIIQVFDSWAGHIDDDYYGLFCEPYQRRVVQGIKEQHPDTPIIIYMAPGPYSSGGRRLKALAGTGVDIVSVDHTIDLSIAREILSDYDSVGLQGNLDPQLLRDGPMDEIRSRTLTILETIRGRKKCILNLGHGILPDTPEIHAECFVTTVQSFRN